MKSKLRGGFLFFLVCSIISCGFVLMWQEKPQCDIKFLVLDETKMSKGWQNGWGVLPPALDDLGAEHAFMMAMEKGNKGASHTVYQYSNRWFAIFHMWFDKPIFFLRITWTWSDWETGKRLPLQADQQQIKCGVSNDPYFRNRCVAVLRYGSYISEFGISFEEDEVNAEEFEEIILKIDEQFRVCQAQSQ